MNGEVSITVLVDDAEGAPGLCAEHGLALWIETGGRRILFDTGQSGCCTRNAEKLGIDLGTADTLVVSHGHYDHAGGVPRFLAMNSSASMYCHPGISAPRYSRRSDGAMRPVGISAETAAALDRAADRVRWVTGPVWVSERIGITGPVPRASSFEDTGGAFFLDPQAQRVDQLEDDLSMWFVTAEGLVVVTGCCHSGIVNTLLYVERIAGPTPVCAVIGGFHLINASEERIGRTVAAVNGMGALRRLVPCHCTGEMAVGWMEKECRAAVVRGCVGMVVTF